MHTIRLRGPWEYRRAEETDAAYQRLKLPADWSSVLGDANQASTFEFRRTFHKPTGLNDSDTVWLVLEGLPNATVHLNELSLGVTSADSSARFEIASKLDSRNHLRVTLKLQPGEPCHGEVSLEIAGQ